MTGLSTQHNECPICLGNGYTTEVGDSEDGPEPYQEQCYECGGSGEVESKGDGTMTDEKMTTDWDKEAIYDNEISPLVSQIIAICKREELPLLLSVQYADTEDDGPAFCTTALLPEHASESLRNGFRGLKAGPPVMAMTITSGRKP